MSVFSHLASRLVKYRSRLVLVAVLSGVIAVLWGLNISAAFPIVKVLLERESLTTYVDEQIELATTRIDQQTERLDDLDEPDTESTRVLRRRAREQSKLTSHSYKLLILQWFKRKVLPLLPTDSFELLCAILGVFVFGTVLKGVLVVVQEMLAQGVVQRTVNEIRESVYLHLLHLDYGTVSQRKHTDLLSHLTYDLQEFSTGLALLVARAIREPLKIIVCVSLALFISWRLTLLTFVLLPFVGTIFHQLGRRVKQASRKKLEAMASMQETLEETLTGIQVVLTDQGEERQQRKFEAANETYLARTLDIARLSAFIKPMTEVIGFAAVLVALLPGAWMVMHSSTHFLGVRFSATPLDVARLMVLYTMLAGCLDPLRKLSEMLSVLKRSSAAGERVFSILELETRMPTPTVPKQLPKGAPTLKFEQLGFSYPVVEGQPPRPPALREIDLEIRSGEVVAFVGPNGCGKSTLLSLVTRLYDPTEGEVLAENIDLRSLILDDWRARLAFVPQDTQLFQGTIAENIRYGSPDATDEQFQEAGRIAGVTHFLDRVSNGWQSDVGPRGRQLSGGQRQRIALARALLRQPDLLVLDEPTSAVDPVSADHIHHCLQSVRGRMSILLVTHQVTESLLALEPRFVVLDQGHIVGDGSHQELLTGCETYRKLFAESKPGLSESMEMTTDEDTSGGMAA